MEKLKMYSLDGEFIWPDKKKAMLAANAPITATLRPVVTDSVGRDGTPCSFDRTRKSEKSVR